MGTWGQTTMTHGRRSATSGMLQVALASNQKATQLVPLEGAKKDGALLAGLLQRSAAKHRLKMSKKKPFSLFRQCGSPISSDEDLQNLRAGDSLILCTTEGDRREMARQVGIAHASPAPEDIDTAPADTDTAPADIDTAPALPEHLQ